MNSDLTPHPLLLVRLPAPPLIQARELEHQVDEGTHDEDDPRGGQFYFHLGECVEKRCIHKADDDRFK